jgi:DNA mismatch endonuclease (patch repair protein)
MNSRSRDPQVVSKTMRRVRSVNTTAELLIRRELHRRGLRFRLHDSRLPGKPDLLFGSARVAVFVNGDFWHGRQWQLRGLPDLASQFPNNAEYWIQKIGRNVERDRKVREHLLEDGWDVVTIWESDLKRDLASCADQVEELVRSKKGCGRSNAS